ncbi:hypothetical protein BD779DRAFT_1786688 [Infundibulicybe gibba]|nr:hypothetical protein BD779DRAFT_1786688 [Infundibulicybe gibba]
MCIPSTFKRCAMARVKSATNVLLASLAPKPRRSVAESGWILQLSFEGLLRARHDTWPVEVSVRSRLVSPFPTSALRAMSTTNTSTFNSATHAHICHQTSRLRKRCGVTFSCRIPPLPFFGIITRIISPACLNTTPAAGTFYASRNDAGIARRPSATLHTATSSTEYSPDIPECPQPPPLARLPGPLPFLPSPGANVPIFPPRRVRAQLMRRAVPNMDSDSDSDSDGDEIDPPCLTIPIFPRPPIVRVDVTRSLPAGSIAPGSKAYQAPKNAFLAPPAPTSTAHTAPIIPVHTQKGALGPTHGALPRRQNRAFPSARKELERRERRALEYIGADTWIAFSDGMDHNADAAAEKKEGDYACVVHVCNFEDDEDEGDREGDDGKKVLRVVIDMDITARTEPGHTRLNNSQIRDACKFIRNIVESGADTSKVLITAPHMHAVDAIALASVYTLSTGFTALITSQKEGDWVGEAALLHTTASIYPIKIREYSLPTFPFAAPPPLHTQRILALLTYLHDIRDIKIVWRGTLREDGITSLGDILALIESGQA